MIDNYISLTLGTFLDIDAILQSDKEEIDKQVAIIALLSGETEQDILALPLADYAALAAKTDFLRQECPPVTAPARVVVGGRAYIPVKDFTKVTTAQYVDFQTFSKGGTQKLPELLAVLLVPDGKAYGDGYDFADVVADVRTLPLPVALSLVGFFFAALSQSIEVSLTSLGERSRKMTRTKAKEIEKIISQTRELLAGAGLQM